MQCRDEIERRRGGKKGKSYMLPPSPSHSLSSSSSSDFEFTVSISPCKSSTPADELFYKGQLLPLNLYARISMVCNLILSSSTAARDSTAVVFPDHDDPSHPSYVTEDDDFKRLHNKKTTNNYFSKSSSIFRKHNPKTRHPKSVSGSSMKRRSNTAKEVIRKYMKKVKPLYEKLSLKQSRNNNNNNNNNRREQRHITKIEISTKEINGRKETKSVVSHSFIDEIIAEPLRKQSGRRDIT